MTEYEAILQKYWGYPSFRPLQKEIIQWVCQGKDALGLLPTGGGKSIIFQVASLSKPGICIVITPLIALMKDQVDNLKKRGILSAAVYTGMSRIEIQTVLDNCVLGNYKFLYISPERLKTELFLSFVTQMKVNLLVVDESHCISQWGYDFRPAYLEIAAVRELLPNVAVLALTATATPDVVNDIQEKLAFRHGKVFLKSFERKNLTYNVNNREDKIGALLKLCAQYKESTGIVYVRTRKETLETAYILQQNGFVADYYHGGLDAATRNRKQEVWMHAKHEIMVSTNAFGMGIDKPDVRFVVHLTIPESIEAYFQEAGRAGRDEKDSVALLLYNNSDIEKLKENFEASYPSFDVMRTIYNALYDYSGIAVGYGEGVVHDYDILDFCKKFKLNALEVSNTIRLLQSEGLITTSDVDASSSRVQFTVERSELYKFQVENQNYDAFIKFLLRMYSGVFTEPTELREDVMARKANCDTSIIVKYLTALEQQGLLQYFPARLNPIIVFQRDRQEKQYIQFNEKVILARKQRQRQRLEAVIQYVTSQGRCRSVQLLEYFGEKNSSRCGNCDVCESRNEVEVAQIPFDYIVEDLKRIIGVEPAGLDEILLKSSVKDEQRIASVIKFLLDKQKLKYVSGARLLWNKN